MAVSIVLLAVDNTDDVGIGYVFGDLSGPLWAVSHCGTGRCDHRLAHTTSAAFWMTLHP